MIKPNLYTRGDQMKKIIITIVFLTIAFALSGCKLYISDFVAQDSAEIGQIIDIIVTGIGEGDEDEDEGYKLILQLPESWVIVKAAASGIYASEIELIEMPDYEKFYTPELGYKIHVLNYDNASTYDDLQVIVTVIVGNFSGEMVSSKTYNLKAAASIDYMGRNGIEMYTEDPENIFDFAAISDDKYVESILITCPVYDDFYWMGYNDSLVRLITKNHG